MDAFYASVEQRDNPELQGKPVAVGHGKARGVVAAASYEARKYGVRSAMPAITAKNRCPELIFVPPRREVYKQVSEQIQNIFLEYTPLVEPLSLDEAFLDVTSNHKNNPSAISIAKEIQERIFQETSLTASAGVSVNKFLAKIASEQRKPNGLFTILPDDIDDFVASLKIEQFYGVGKVTARKMHENGIFTGRDLRQRSKKELVRLFGKVGYDFYLYARGIDNREVESERIIKSISNETTFLQDKDNPTLLTVELYNLAKKVFARMKKEDFYGRTMTIKIKYADFKTITRSRTLAQKITAFEQFWPIARQMMKEIDFSVKPVRLIGFGVSNADDDNDEKFTQLELKLF